MISELIKSSKLNNIVNKYLIDLKFISVSRVIRIIQTRRHSRPRDS